MTKKKNSAKAVSSNWRKPSARESGPGFARLAANLTEIGKEFHSRGWVLGTSGNFSAVVSRRPLRLAITSSQTPTGDLAPRHILLCDDQGAVVGRRGGKPSAEALLHIAIAKRRKAGAVLHTHSVWSTLLSDRYAADGGLAV